jgi:histidinol-phosphate aminotransferase
MLHGGDIYRNKVNIDFSVNINPLGMPDAVRKALSEAVGNCEQYPDIKAERLTESLAERMGVNKEYILPGNGASELFTAIVHAVNPGRIVIPVPSFLGYEKAVMSSHGEVLFYEMKEDMGYTLDEGIMEYLTEGTDLLFLANPNNPVGNLIDSTLLEQVAEECRKKQILIVLDECFLEFSGKEEKYSYKNKLEAYPNVIVVRAFTKIYAIPGVRLGYLLCGDSELRKRIEVHLPEWNLSVFAQAAGIAACLEKNYIAESVRVVEAEREYLKEELEQLGIKVYPSDADYLLIKTDMQLYDELLKKEILIRDCSNFRGLGRGYYRIAVKKHSDNVMLIKAIREIGEMFQILKGAWL